MVDFLKKASTYPVERPSQNVQHETIDKAEDPWIDITDDFGRTRLVRKSEALKMEVDKELAALKQIRDEEEELLKRSEMLYSNTPKEPIEILQENGHHYDNSKEIRTMGVGFYQFSGNADDRSKQMSDLKDLRDTTITARNKKLSFKESKKKAKEDRMTAILLKSREQRMIMARASDSIEIDKLFNSLQ